MANWCNNNLTFTGSKDNILNLSKIILEMKHRGDKQNQGVLPIIQEDTNDLHFFYIEYLEDSLNDNLEDEDDYFININYQTKWNPNILSVTWLSRKMGVSFELDYEESGNLVYGKYKMDHEDSENKVYNKYLTDDEYNSCKYIESSNGLITHDRDAVSEEDWDRLIDEEDYSEMEDYEKLEDTLDEKNWELYM